MPESTPLLIVYGGAFDPPHQGHVDCLRLTAQRFLEATFLVAPAFDPAGAAGQHKRTKVSFSDRIRLCQLAFDAEKTGIEAHRLTVSPIEAELPSPNYTIQTLESVASRNPGVRLCFLVGQDQLESFHQWHRPLEILKIASLIVVKRDTTTGYGGLLRKSVDLLAERLDQPLEWQTSFSGAASRTTQAVFKQLGSWIYIIDQPISVAASSLIRDFLGKGQRLPSNWLPKTVQEYIDEKHLYR